MFTFKGVWKKIKLSKNCKNLEPSGSRIFTFFLEFLVFFSHFLKGMNKEKYHFDRFVQITKAVSANFGSTPFVKYVLKN